MNTPAKQRDPELERHLENIVRFREMKAQGLSDRKIISKLGIGFAQLYEYKQAIADLEIDVLSPDFVQAKKLELDEQVQATIGKLYEIVGHIEEYYYAGKQIAEKAIKDLDSEDSKYVDTLLKLRRSLSYPAKEVTDVTKILLEAIKVRAHVWDMDNGNGDGVPGRPQKITVRVSDIPKLKKDVGKLNNIADAITGQNGTLPEV